MIAYTYSEPVVFLDLQMLGNLGKIIDAGRPVSGIRSHHERVRRPVPDEQVRPQPLGFKDDGMGMVDSSRCRRPPC